MADVAETATPTLTSDLMINGSLDVPIDSISNPEDAVNRSERLSLALN